MTLYELNAKSIKLEALNKLLSADEPSPPENYVLIIDEINRGNISKILGELITLLEPDKCLGVIIVFIDLVEGAQDVLGFFEKLVGYARQIFSWRGCCNC